MTQHYQQMTTIQKIAVGSSAAIIAAAAIYWAVQIFGVIEFLQMAYGE
jgi:hypothetical protein